MAEEKDAHGLAELYRGAQGCGLEKFKGLMELYLKLYPHRERAAKVAYGWRECVGILRKLLNEGYDLTGALDKAETSIDMWELQGGGPMDSDEMMMLSRKTGTD